MRKTLWMLAGLVLVIPMVCVATTGELEDLGTEGQTPEVVETETTCNESEPSEPWLVEPLEMEASGTCGAEDLCQDPLPSCNVAADCLAYCPVQCQDPICVPVRQSFCIWAPPVGDKVCECL